MHRLPIAVAAMLFILGCQPALPQGSASGPVGSVLAELREEAGVLAARGEYEAAVLRYRAVLNRQPDDLSLHAALGEALFRSGRRQEAIEVLQRVVERGAPGSPEVHIARRRLTTAGVLTEADSLALALPDSLLAEFRAEGNALAARGEYEAAALRYRAVLNRQPDDLSLQFALGSALSHLGRQAEVIDAFRRVVDRGRPDSPEVQIARRWLVSAGVLGETATFAPLQSPHAATSAVDPATTGSVKGKTEWKGLDPGSPTPALKVQLEGGDDAAGGNRYGTRTRLGEPYRVDGLLPGSYKLHGFARGVRLWSEIPLTVEAGKETVVDLSPSNSRVQDALGPPPTDPSS